MKKEVEKEFSELFAFTDKQYSEPHKINFNNNEQKIMNELEYNICQIFISIDKQSSDNLFFYCFVSYLSLKDTITLSYILRDDARYSENVVF